jgi:hypothetical protein
VYACFADHCAAANGSQPGCAANGGTGCCTEGREGLLCESCSEGYIKQQDACIPCAGNAWVQVLAMFGAKTACLFLVNAQLLAKATTKSCALYLQARLMLDAWAVQFEEAHR